MSATGPLATVVIPTHNRAAALVVTLGDLDRQDCGVQAFEVVVVPNGCTDDTSARLRGYEPRYRLRVVEIDAPSASLARNTGVDHARAPLIIFLDDDVAPVPSFVSAHLGAHEERPRVHTAPAPDRVVIGYVSALLQGRPDRFAITMRARWEARFDSMRRTGHRFRYADLFSGNFSMSRTRFLDLGGFDVSLRCHEDHDLGFRLIAAGAQFVFAEGARGTHAVVPSLASACERKRQEGRADVQLAQRFPDLRAVVPLARPRTLTQRLSRALAFGWPALGTFSIRTLIAALPLLDRIGATSSWRHTLSAVFAYWYDRGLADAAGTRETLASLGASEQGPAGAAGIDIDLAGGLKSALHEVDSLRPLAATLVAGHQRIGHIPWVPGAEPLAARHVAAALLYSFSTLTFETLRSAGHVRLTTPAAAPPPHGVPHAEQPPLAPAGG